MIGSVRHRLAVAAVAAVAAVGLRPDAAEAQQAPLTIVSWGGSYTASQMIAYVNPYRERTDRWVRVVDYNGGLSEIEAQVSALNVTWDVVDLGLSDAIRGCEQGLLEEIDPAILEPAPDGTPAAEDFLEEGLRTCAIGQNVFSTVVGYKKGRYANPPQSIADFFNLERYPGRRGLRKNPRVVLEWALMADGVAPAEIYDVLSTEEGVDRAFAKLDTIKRQIVWWDNAATPPKLLAEGAVAMTQTYNGRIQDAIDGGADQAILWDGQVRDIELWGIPKGSRNKEAALDFISFATQSERMAEQSRHIAYGPARKSALAMLADEMKAKLPTAEANSQNAIWSNHGWWAENQERLNARFTAWRTSEAGQKAPTEGTAR
jgi:putative spermidine/putrescine transport system substrate-binding protein